MGRPSHTCPLLINQKVLLVFPRCSPKPTRKLPAYRVKCQNKISCFNNPAELGPHFYSRCVLENICSSLSEQWQKWPGKGARWECLCGIPEAFPALISPPSRHCNWGFRSAGCAAAAEAEIANKDTSQECLPGAGAEFRGGAEEFSSPALGKCVCPHMKAFWGVHSCIFCGVSGGCGESQPLGAVGRGQGELWVALVLWRSHGILPLLSSALLKPQVGIFHLKQVI